MTLIVALVSAQPVNASGYAKGQVEFIRTHDGAVSPGWEAPKFWFSLKGGTSAGTCRAWATGTVLFVGTDKQMLSLVLSAQATGQEVAVYWDDTRLVNGFCTAGYITIGNPAPAF